MKVDQQRHGYVGGHQLLASSTTLDAQDQGIIDRLSDIGGQPGPNESVPEYLTGYPLPSGRFFAFARTWYDTSAPRAGCVLTHTLLVPANEWATLKSLRPLALHHSWFERQRLGRALPQIDVLEAGRQPYPPVQSKGLAELCEAIFLEERRPIVWMTEPDDDVVLRLIEAFWPALRGRFAFQTYALKPRSKGHGLFDLMAAPRSARSRFSAWEGRRIDGDAPPRHAFTPLLVDSIFESPYPDLEPVDPLGVLSRDQVGDPAKLRLSILWNHLRASAEDPNTTLGMLDVLSAAALPRKSRWKLAKPLFESILGGAGSDIQRTSSLIEIALGKLDPGDGEHLVPSLRRSLTHLLEADPDAALRLVSTQWRDTSVAPILQQAAADSLVSSAPGRTWAVLRQAPDGLAAELVDRNYALLPALAEHSSDDRSDWSWFADLLRRLEPDKLELLRPKLLSMVNSGAQAPLLTTLLSGAEPPHLVQALRRLHGSGALDDPALVDAFVKLKGLTTSEKLDSAISAHLPATDIQPLYEALLEPRVWAIDWVLSADLPTRLRSQLLVNLLTRMTRPERASLVSSEQRQRFDEVVKNLLKTENGQELAAELINDTHRMTEETFELALNHFAKQQTGSARVVLASLIERLTPLRNEVDAERLGRVLSARQAPVAFLSVAPSITDLLIPPRISDPEVTYSLGLSVASELAIPMRPQFLQGLRTLAERASDYRVRSLSAEAYVCWGQLVLEAAANGGRTGACAPDDALGYVFRREFGAAEPLAHAAFPIVFKNVFGSSKKSRKKAEELTVKMLRVFLRNRWDGVNFLLMLLHTGQPDFAFDVAIRYSYESRRYLEDAAKRFESGLTIQRLPQGQELHSWIDEEYDKL